MRFFSAFLLGFAPLIFGFSSFASDEDLLKQRIARHLNTVQSRPESLDLAPQILTRMPSGPVLYRSPVTQQLYPRLVNGVVYIVSGDGLTGSGTIISSSFGLIITNWHVVGKEPIVGLVFKPAKNRGRTSFRKEDVFLAHVLKTDAIHDLALLQVISPPRKMIAVPLGSTSRIEVGHDVFSVSHPQGSLWSFHEGVISQIEPDHEWVSEINTIHRGATIHTEAVDSSGNSGDPLFSSNGQFIGMLAGSSKTGSNFAISVDEIRNFVFSSLR